MNDASCWSIYAKHITIGMNFRPRRQKVVQFVDDDDVHHLVALYDGGKGAKHSLISPKEATSYFTISGKSLPRYISK